MMYNKKKILCKNCCIYQIITNTTKRNVEILKMNLRIGMDAGCLIDQMIQNHHPKYYQRLGNNMNMNL